MSMAKFSSKMTTFVNTEITDHLYYTQKWEMVEVIKGFGLCQGLTLPTALAWFSLYLLASLLARASIFSILFNCYF